MFAPNELKQEKKHHANPMKSWWCEFVCNAEFTSSIVLFHSRERTTTLASFVMLTSGQVNVTQLAVCFVQSLKEHQ